MESHCRVPTTHPAPLSSRRSAVKETAAHGCCIINLLKDPTDIGNTSSFLLVILEVKKEGDR